MKKYRSKKDIPAKYYICQTLLGFMIIYLTLFTLDYFSDIAILGAIGATSLGASTFIAFGSPHSTSAQTSRILGSYLLGCIVGVICFDILHLLLLQDIGVGSRYLHEIIGASAVGLTMILMFIFGLEHPPAVGIALGLVFEQWDFATLSVILTAIILIVMLKTLLKPYMKNLF